VSSRFVAMPSRKDPNPADELVAQFRPSVMRTHSRYRLRAKGRSPALYAGAGPSRRIPRTLSIVAPSAGDSVTHQVAPAAP
jgi:hypothetical protein